MLIAELQTSKNSSRVENHSNHLLETKRNLKSKRQKGINEKISKDDFSIGDFVSDEDEDDRDDDDGDDDCDDDDGDDGNDDNNDDDDVNDRHLYPPCNGALTLGLG